MSTSTSPSTAGLRFAYVSSAARSASSPCSGRTSAASNSGSPTGPLSTATADRQVSTVSCGSGLPVARIAAPPSRRSSSSTLGASASSTSRASADTSGPIPSPGRRTTLSLPVGKDSLGERARLPSARARREPCRLHRLVPAAEHARNGLARRVVLAGLIPFARQRRPRVLAVPERDRVDDRLGRPAEPSPRPGSHATPPTVDVLLDLDTKRLQDLVCVRLDANRVVAVCDEARRLEAVAGDEQHDAVALSELPALDCGAQRTNRDRGRRLAEDTGRLREERDVVD